MAHITGGGITENLPRVFPDGCAAVIDRTAWTPPPLFKFLQDRGGIAEAEMLRAFNMGIGLVIVCAAADAAAVVSRLEEQGERPIPLGEVVRGAGTVSYTPAV
jgi:phosphoribosylformylglycinamidine cyclo-ligase